LIIGAGINGIGTFRDLALQGVDVVMVDRGDFCGGASAASSYMVHGGIRYLENGEIRLVREAVHERNRLLENAPHYTKPLPTTIPIFKWFSGLFNAPLKFIGLLNRPAERGGIVIKLGLIMYDAFTAAQCTVPPHSFALRGESLRLYPQISPEIVCTATYFDGFMPVLSLIGGKWTTFRAFSEQVTDAILRRLNRARVADTKRLPIGGGRAYPASPQARQTWLAEQSRASGVPVERLTALFERYGTRAADLARLISAQADKSLRNKPDYSRAEVAAIARQEFVTHLDDFLLRRSLLAMVGELTLPLVEELAEVIGNALDWPAERRRAEIEQAR